MYVTLNDNVTNESVGGIEHHPLHRVRPRKSPFLDLLQFSVGIRHRFITFRVHFLFLIAKALDGLVLLRLAKKLHRVNPLGYL